MDVKQIFGANVARLRTEAGWTQLELSEKLNYSDKTISKWERGESIPDVSTIQAVAALFGVTMDDLLTDPDGKEPHFVRELTPEELARKRRIHISIWTIVSVGYWAAVLIALFVILNAANFFFWKLLVFALPVQFILSIVFGSLWAKKKQPCVFINILCLVASILAIIYVIFLSQNLWQLFLFLIPTLIILLLSFNIFKNKSH